MNTEEAVFSSQPAVAIVGGIPFYAFGSPNEATQWFMQNRQVIGERGYAVRFANAYCVASANRSDAYGELMKNGSPNLPDGAPVAFHMRSQRDLPVRASRVRGPSFFRAVLDASQDSEVTHFFLGSTDEVLSRLTSTIRQVYPGVLVAGAYSPPFAPLSADSLAELTRRVRQVSPDVIWVGMGSPKQDFVAQHLAETLHVPALGVGAAFDFMAGSVSEAPLWIQNSGFEWLYRLVSEPRRLWRRYLVGNAQFMVDCLRYRTPYRHQPGA